jgi:hypothetical protein
MLYAMPTACTTAPSCMHYCIFMSYVLPQSKCTAFTPLILFPLSYHIPNITHQLENIGYTVRTLDNKHADAVLDKHCTANFSDTRRMMRSMGIKFPGEQFNHVILDYFFSPVSYAMPTYTHACTTAPSCMHYCIFMSFCPKASACTTSH